MFYFQTIFHEFEGQNFNVCIWYTIQEDRASPSERAILNKPEILRPMYDEVLRLLKIRHKLIPE